MTQHHNVEWFLLSECTGEYYLFDGSDKPTEAEVADAIVGMEWDDEGDSFSLISTASWQEVVVEDKQLLVTLV